MMLTIAWKELREHRSIWLTMVLMTSLFALALGQFASSDAGGARLGLTILGMAAAYGVVCGAMMFAGEREAGTMVFLDIFLGRRGLLWWCKVLIGMLLAVTEALAVAIVLRFLLHQTPPAWMLPFIGRESSLIQQNFHLATAPPALWFQVLPLITLEAYAWGVLGSSMTQRVLTGAALAAVIAAPFWLFSVFAPPPVFLAIRLLTAGLALILSSLILLTQSRDTPLGPPPKRDDDEPHPLRRRAEYWERDRFDLESRAPRLAQRAQAELDIPQAIVLDDDVVHRVRSRRWRPPQAYSPAHVLLWLTFSQCWLICGILAAASIVVGILVPAYGQVLWPVATLLLGVACGTATFAHEQRDLSYQFLAAQHFPLTSFWNVKVLFWLCVACLVALLTGAIAAFTALMKSSIRPIHALEAPVTFLGAFHFGSLREFLGPVLFFGVWLVYGFAVGQVFVLLCRKNVLAVLLATMVSAAAIGLWLPSLLCLGMSGWQVFVPPLVMIVATRLLMRAWAGGRIKERRPMTALIGFGLATVAWAGLVFGLRAWEVPDVGEPVDRLAFRDSLAANDNAAGTKIHAALAEMDDPDAKPLAWLKPLREAGQLPVGMLEVPRRDGTLPSLRHLPSCRKMAERLAELAERALAEDRAQAAVDHFADILFLSRNLRNKAPLLSYLIGVEVEESALEGMERWLARGRPGPEVLRRALQELNRHAAETPPAVDCLETECFRSGGALDNTTQWSFYSGRDSPGRVPETWLAGAIGLALDMPWEAERKTRLWQAVWDGLLRHARTPHWELPKTTELEVGNATTRQILHDWIPATQGAGASLTAERLARLLDASWVSDDRLFTPVRTLRMEATRAQWRVHTLRLQAALGLYQLNEKKQAKNLSDLLPKYLPELPIDPYSGQTFGYRLSNGERIDVLLGDELVVPAGAAILWSTGRDGVDHGGRRHGFNLLDDNDRWMREDWDLLRVVPLWPQE